AGIGIARLFYEPGSRTIGRHHNDRLDRLFAGFQLCDGGIHIDSVARIADAKRVASIPAAQDTHRFSDTRETGISKCILLSENGNLVWGELAAVDEVLHNRICLLRVARAIIEDVPVGRVAPQDACASEGSKKEHTMFKRERCRYHGGWRSDIADKTEHLVLLVKLFDGFGSPCWLIA